MASATLEQAIKLVDQLSVTEQHVLLEHLKATLAWPETSIVTIEAIRAEHERRLAAGAFDNVRSLANRWARPGLDLSFEDIDSDIREFYAEWEKGMDEYLGEN